MRVAVLLVLTIIVVGAVDPYAPQWKVACFDAATGALAPSVTPDGYCAGETNGPAESVGCTASCAPIDGWWTCADPTLFTTNPGGGDKWRGATGALIDNHRCYPLTLTELTGTVSGGKDPTRLFQLACFNATTGRTVAELLPDGFCGTSIAPASGAAAPVCAEYDCDEAEGNACEPVGTACSCVSSATRRPSPIRNDPDVRCAHVSAIELSALLRHPALPLPF